MTYDMPTSALPKVGLTDNNQGLPAITEPHADSLPIAEPIATIEVEEQPHQLRENYMKGFLLALGAFAAFSFSDASVKMIEGALPPIESAFFGAVFSLAAVAALLFQGQGNRVSDVFATHNRLLWLLRFASYPLGIIGSVTAFTHLGMAEAFALIFLQPTFAVLLSLLFLKEHVKGQDWVMLILGFIGVLVVLRPGFRELSIGHLGAIVAGFTSAISMVCFRSAPKEEKPVSLFGAGIIGGIVVCGLFAIPGFKVPTLMQWVFLAGYGLLAALANILLMYAMKHARATLISPTQYSQMLWAVFLGYVLFKDSIDVPTISGIALILASGLIGLVTHRGSNSKDQATSAAH